MPPYEIETTSLADSQLSRCPPALQRAVIRELFCLAGDVTALSQSAPPLYGEVQLFRTDFRFGDMTCELDVRFKFSQDERKLIVNLIDWDFVI